MCKHRAYRGHHLGQRPGVTRLRSVCQCRVYASAGCIPVQSVCQSRVWRRHDYNCALALWRPSQPHARPAGMLGGHENQAGRHVRGIEGAGCAVGTNKQGPRLAGPCPLLSLLPFVTHGNGSLCGTRKWFPLWHTEMVPFVAHGNDSIAAPTHGSSDLIAA